MFHKKTEWAPYHMNRQEEFRKLFRFSDICSIREKRVHVVIDYADNISP